MTDPMTLTRYEETLAKKSLSEVLHETKTPFVHMWVDGVVSGDSWPFQRHSTVMKFSNGYSISIVYGSMIYSSDINGDKFQQHFIKNATLASTVEVAIFDPENQFVEFLDGQQVKGFVTPDELADIIVWVKNIGKEQKTNG